MFFCSTLFFLFYFTRTLTSYYITVFNSILSDLLLIALSLLIFFTILFAVVLVEYPHLATNKFIGVKFPPSRDNQLRRSDDGLKLETLTSLSLHSGNLISLFDNNLLFYLPTDAAPQFLQKLRVVPYTDMRLVTDYVHITVSPKRDTYDICDARLEYHYAAVIKKVKDTLPCNLNGSDTNSI